MKEDGGHFNANDWDEYEGISHRDWLAGLAMQGIAVDMPTVNRGAKAAGVEPEELVAQAAYDLADAMIREGGKKRG